MYSRGGGRGYCMLPQTSSGQDVDKSVDSLFRVYTVAEVSKTLQKLKYHNTRFLIRYYLSSKSGKLKAEDRSSVPHWVPIYS